VRLWKSQPVLQRRQFFQGRPIRGDQVHDLLWLTPHGRRMSDFDWKAGYVRCLGMRLEGRMTDEIDERGRRIIGDTLLILLNSHHEAIPFRLPDHAADEFWQPLLDTAQEPLFHKLWSQDMYPLQGRSLAVLRLAHSWTRIWRRWWPLKRAPAGAESPNTAPRNEPAQLAAVAGWRWWRRLPNGNVRRSA
jgi:glycogen operon protein